MENGKCIKRRYTQMLCLLFPSYFMCTADAQINNINVGLTRPNITTVCLNIHSKYYALYFAQDLLFISLR